MLKTWRFTRGDNTAYSSPTYDDRRWQTVAVPHDWAISGPFDREIDKQTVAIEQNGEREATEKTGRSGSLPWIGTGWYRTKVTLPAATQRALLCFDGAMAEPLVFVNGQKAGEWKYGYTPFNIDITPFLRTDGGENVIAVRLENVEESSRWYPGAGIYRPVTLVTTNATAIRQWSVNATTLRLNHDGTATTALTAEVTQQDTRPLEVIYTLQTDTRQLTRFTVPVAPDGTAETIQTVGRITPWTPETPNLYNLTATLCAVEPDGTRKTLDSVTRRIGFRTVSCTAQGGSTA